MKSGQAAFYGLALIVLCVVGNAVVNRSPAAGTAMVSTPPTTAEGDTQNNSNSNSKRSIWALSASTPRPVMSVTPSPSAIPTETPDRYADLHGTQTAVALQEIELQLADTEQAQQLKSDGATSTTAAQITSTAVQAAVNTSTAQTAVAAMLSTDTQRAAETQTAVPLTHAAATKTQEILDLKANVKKVEIVGVPILLVVLAVVFAYLGWVFLQRKIETRTFQDSQIRPDDKGRLPAMPESTIPGKSKKIINPNMAHRAVIDPAHDDMTPEQAMANTEAQRDLEKVRALADSPALRRQLLRAPKPVTTVTDMQLPEGNVPISQPVAGLLRDDQIVTPPWTLMNNWDGQGPIPYGVSARGLERVSIQQVPHGGIFGQTGKGKSRYFLRPFIAGAIAAGQRVVILGKQADFWPFAQHPNVKMIAVRHITQEEEAARYAEYLKRIVEEMNRRDDYLTSHQVSTWDRAGRENTLIILDELGNALDMMPGRIREDAYRWVQGLVKEGRKAGFNVWLASQRAVGFKSIVEQLGRAVFYLADADASRHALGMPGAETLSDGHFFAKFQGLHKCAAFDPTDDELTAFLQSRPVKMYEPIDWIDGEVTDVASAPTPEAQTSEPAIAGDSEEIQIRSILERMIRDDNRVSFRQVEREVWGKVRGGQYYEKVLKVWKDIKGATATATPEMPESGAIAPL